MTVKAKDAVLIMGPTASGKSAMALALARDADGIVVNADSMQVYDGLAILTARPDEAAMEGIPHVLYGHVPPSVAHSTGAWLREVEAVIAAHPGRRLVFVGGTGLYFRALLGGLSDMPDIPGAIRDGLRAELAVTGAAAMHRRLAEVDPASAAGIREGDGQRIARALEVHAASGRPFSAWRAQEGRSLVDTATARRLIIAPDRAALHARINARFDRMVEAGAADEARHFLARGLDPRLPAMGAIGVREFARHFAGETGQDEAIEAAKARTRQYAKRQETWMRHQPGADWIRLAMPSN